MCLMTTDFSNISPRLYNSNLILDIFICVNKDFLLLQISVWGAISMKGPSPLAIFEGTVDSEAYQAILDKHLLPKIRTKFQHGYRFQQDNARPHTSRSTTTWMEQNQINLWETPVESPGMLLNLLKYYGYLIKLNLLKITMWFIIISC